MFISFFLILYYFNFSYFIDDYVISFLLFDNSLSNNKLDIRLYLMQFSMYSFNVLNIEDKIVKRHLLIQVSANYRMMS